jgi:hypothetical protein
MPLLHCSNCHHEYESYKDNWENDLCDWCGCTPYLLKDKTELELMCDAGIDIQLDLLMNELKDINQKVLEVLDENKENNI